MIASDSFGKIDGFSVGDLVRWSRLEDKKTGIIRSLKLEYEGGRNVAYADIILLGTSKTEQICCIVLEKIAQSMTKN
tara:strand:+ start:148 stop:378 length:231 start_codon:yes stop_codon:yes gene_type:complete